MNILQTAIESLWYWTYGIILGWGASFTIAVGLIIILFIKYFRLRNRVTMLENRVIMAERELSFHIRDTKDAISYASKHMSDKEYQVSTNEKQKDWLKNVRKTEY